jgi:hypothetical protein
MVRIFALLLTIPLLAGCDWIPCGEDCVKGSGVITTETRPVGTFKAIRLSNFGKLVIERTGTESLTVTADDNIVSLITSEVRDGTLYLAVKGKSVSSRSLVYKVTVGDLREISVSGAATIEATKLDGDSLSLDISGAGSGTMSGRADVLSISISGAGSLDAGGLVAKRAKVVVSGAGDVTVNASEELDAKVSGAGTVRYIGSPRLTTNISGVGSVKKKE